MAKKSAASKGYRKTQKKKPFLTKKEIIELVIFVAVIALAVILFNLFYDDGFIDAKEVQANDVVAYASNNNRQRYRKVGEANELEGFTRTDNRSESNALCTFTYTPDVETDHIANITLTGIHVKAETMVDSTLSSYYSMDGVQASEKIATTVQDHDAFVYGYTYDYYDEASATEAPAEDAEVTPAETEAPAGDADAAPAETEAPAEDADAAPAETEAPAEDAEAAPAETEAPAENAEEPASNIYCQNLSLYVQIDDSHALALHIARTGDDDSFYIPEDQYLDYVLKYADAFTVVQDKK